MAADNTGDIGAARGTTLVFVHGSGDSGQVWNAVIARLGAYSCLALDLPGHGRRLDEPGPVELSVAGYAASVAEELTRRDLSGACLVGHSLGGAIALTLALDWPALVSKLVLVGAGARLRVRPDLLEGAKTNPDATMRELVALGSASGHERDAERAVAALLPVAPGVLYRDLAACNAFDIMGDLPRITQPSLIITGAEDLLTPPKYATFLRERLPHAKTVTVPDAGHYVIGEAPDAVAAAITSWLAEDERMAPAT